jgi:hypothetical protein
MSEACQQFESTIRNFRIVQCHPSTISRLRITVAQKLVVERFEAFDANRRAAEALAADEADIAQLEEMEKAATGRKKGDDNA